MVNDPLLDPVDSATPTSAFSEAVIPPVVVEKELSWLKS
jgi:hypothetical protein